MTGSSAHCAACKMTTLPQYFLDGNTRVRRSGQGMDGGAMSGRYAEAFDRARNDPEGFWGEAARAIDWETPWQRVLDDSKSPFTLWFPGARLNTCHNALDRHVAGGRAAQPALIYDSPVTGQVKRFTYRELRDAVATLAGALRDLGVAKGDERRVGKEGRARAARDRE